MRNLGIKIIILNLFRFCAVINTFAQNPPITPAWALGHIVWEDSINTQEGAKRIVNEYLTRDFPVDGIIIDSPWSTAYNDFNWDPNRYPQADEMLSYLTERNVKTLLWMTGTLNTDGKDVPVQKCDSFEVALSKGYFANDGESKYWWKGNGAHIDFTNQEATQWWYNLMDKAFLEGVYGLKVDEAVTRYGETVKTSRGEITNLEFRKAFYDAMFDYVADRRPGMGVSYARPCTYPNNNLEVHSNVEKYNLGWCGDFTGDWSGLKRQLLWIYKACEAGYSAVGCEVGGFVVGYESTAKQLSRYVQFGCMTALIISGGANGAFSNHLSWWHGPEIEALYRFCVSLHDELRPYLFSTIVEANLNGGCLMRNMSFEEESHMLGNSIFTKAITSEDDNVAFHLPNEGEWIDYWTNERYKGGSFIEKSYPLDKFPLFIKAGSIIPLHIKSDITGIGDASMSGRKVLAIWPNDKSSCQIHFPLGEGVDYVDCHVDYDNQTGELRIRSGKSLDFTILIMDGEKNRIDVSGSNISVNTQSTVGISNPQTTNKTIPVQETLFDLQGIRVSPSHSGIVLKRNLYQGGTAKTSKFLKK